MRQRCSIQVSGPAVNAGLSVSRVGGSAQIKAMKKIAAPIRTELRLVQRACIICNSLVQELDADTKGNSLHRVKESERCLNSH